MKPYLGLYYKRNQVVEAIARILQRGSTKLDSDLYSRVKRLLELDRARGRNRRSRDPEQTHFAFYSADMPGRGYENRFSEFECFSLLTGLRLMAHGWPQSTAVALLRRLRPELEKHHARLLRQGPAVLSDQQQLLAGVRPGDMAVDNLDPLFIVIVSEQGRTGSRSVALCRGQREVFELYHRYGPGYVFTLIELATSIYALSSALAQTQPRARDGHAPNKRSLHRWQSHPILKPERALQLEGAAYRGARQRTLRHQTKCRHPRSTASVMVGPLVGPSSNRSKAEIPKGGQRRAAARKDR